ncbi:MAG: hypothetical protein HYS13_16390 [Planctomycetia bacterium]|nr:hypothetical protein [Planctomycetia bacterium]
MWLREWAERVVRVFVGTVVWVFERLYRWFWYVPLAFDLDELELEHDEEKNAESTIASLVTFAVVQGAALGVGVSGKGALWDYGLSGPAILLAVYFVLGALTCLWIIRTIRFCHLDRDRNPKLRGYDRATTHFGRWALGVSFLLTVVVGVLAASGLLPGQEPQRRFYLVRNVSTDVDFASVWLKAYSNPGHSQVRLDEAQRAEWIRWLNERWSIRPEDAKQYVLVVVEQRGPFDDDYRSFTAEVSLQNAAFEIKYRAAFLKKHQDVHEPPEYRQLVFQYDTKNRQQQTNRFDVLQPNDGERIFLLLVVGPASRNSGLPKTADDMQVTLQNLDARLE